MTRRKIQSVEPGETPLTLSVRWNDGTSDRIDVSDPIERLKIFRPLREGDAFDSVRVADHGWAIAWTGDMALSADALDRLAREQAGEALPAKAFREWRAHHALSLTGAAEALGLSRRTIAYYDSGERPIPKTVWLACKGYDAERRDAA